MSRDPASGADVSALYQYTRQNPVTRVDPDGRILITLGGLVAAGVSVAGGALLGAGIETAVQGAEMLFGDRKDFDTGRIKVAAGVGAVAGPLGKLAKGLLGSSLLNVAATTAEEVLAKALECGVTPGGALGAFLRNGAVIAALGKSGKALGALAQKINNSPLGKAINGAIAKVVDSVGGFGRRAAAKAAGWFGRGARAAFSPRGKSKWNPLLRALDPRRFFAPPGGEIPSDDLIKLQHGTTLKRAEAIMKKGPDANFREPHGPKAGGFSTAAPGLKKYAVGSPQKYAKLKAKNNPGEGGPAVLEFQVPQSIADKADTGHPSEYFFEPGYGLEELIASWPSLDKGIVFSEIPPLGTIDL